MRGDDIKSEWARILQNPPQVYYGMPHAKLIMLGPHRPVRARWPIVGDGDRVKEKLYNIRKKAMAGSLDRLWAVGYEDGWLPENRSAGRGRGRTVQQATTATAIEETSTPRRTKAKAVKRKQVVEVVIAPRRVYSRVPSETEVDEGMYFYISYVSLLNRSHTC